MRVTRARAQAQAQEQGSSKTEAIAAKVQPENLGDDSEPGSSDDGEEYGSKKRKKRNMKTSTSPTKRAKKTQDSSIKKSAGKRKKSLSLLLTMPLDVLFEIFGHMHPRDLVSLARTSKIFKQTLLASDAVTVWMAARKRLGGPDCPPYMTEPAWTALIFGKPECIHCGVRNVHKVDFMLRLRICTTCKKSNLVVESKFSKMFPDADKAVMNLLTYTNVGGWAHGSASKNRFFWKADIEKMIKKYAALKNDIKLRRPNAKKVLDEFVRERQEMIKKIIELSPAHEEWLDNEVAERTNNNYTVQQQRYEDIKARFIALGYTEIDLQYAAYIPQVTQATPLTEQAWKRICPIIEEKIEEAKARRLARDYANLKLSRQRLVARLYKDHVATVERSQWPYLPHPDDVLFYEPFARFLNAPFSAGAIYEDLQDARQLLPTIIKDISDAKKAKFLSQMSTTTGDSAQQADSRSELQAAIEESRFDLATLVFAKANLENSRDHPVVIGWQRAMTHSCWTPERLEDTCGWSSESGVNPDFITLSFSQKGSDVAKKLVELVGLDPHRATIADMDAREERFWCTKCLPGQGFRGRVRTAYSWKDAVSHAVSSPHGDDSELETATFEVMSPSELNQYMQSADSIPPSWRYRQWTCARCLDYFNDYARHPDTIQHVTTEHQILMPKEVEDYFVLDKTCWLRLGVAVPYH
ncbi:hypothetical protein D9613_001206 [Agrocybe pediades]|uniref:F-box domain-containing protein n=1 Tax=Agrocybe pediades TaxID=84607 RepID=A0A8H4VS40_9AGAR|nr:hypothetical protein D9613_001206 [Agrocybe pediades]